MKNKTATRILALIITISLLAILLSEVRIEDIASTLLGLDPLYLLLGFIAYASTYYLRALRFYILLNKALRISDLFNIVCVHNMANNILPARTGELSYVYLLNKTGRKNIGDGVSTLFVARIFDFVFITLFFITSALMTPDISEDSTKIIRTGILFLLLILFMLFNLLYFGKRSLSFVRYIFKIVGAENNALLQLLLNKAEETTNSFNRIKSIGKIGFVEVSIITLFIWQLIYVMNFILVRAMGIDFDFISVLLASSFAVFTNVLPIQGVGGFGTLEGGWTIGFVALGLNLETAINTGFAYHIVIWIYFLILGLFGLIRIRKI